MSHLQAFRAVLGEYPARRAALVASLSTRYSSQKRFCRSFKVSTTSLAKSWSSREGAALRPSGHASALATELRLHKKSPHISVQGRKALKQPQKAQEGEKCLSSSKKSKGAIHHDEGKVSEAAYIGWPFRLCRWYHFTPEESERTMNGY